jgi:hypothetical protein
VSRGLVGVATLRDGFVGAILQRIDMAALVTLRVAIAAAVRCTFKHGV